MLFVEHLKINGGLWNSNETMPVILVMKNKTLWSLYMDTVKLPHSRSATTKKKDTTYFKPLSPKEFLAQI